MFTKRGLKVLSLAAVGLTAGKVAFGELGFERPSLFVTLPAAIVRHSILPITPHVFSDELKEDIVKTRFYFYFKNKENFPEEIDNNYLNKWFNTKTYLGMYMFPS